MPAPTRPQLAIYAALAVAVLLIGARFLRAGDDGGGGLPPVATAPLTSLPDGAGSAPTGGDRVVVDVKGAVRRPGVYRLPADSRVLDAVRRAGGLARGADRIGVNLAARVVDGGEVVVPRRGGAPRAVSAPAGAGSADAPLALDLNTASEQELEQLDGVGPATAAKIVAYREQHGGIGSVDELDEVSGIGPAKLAAIRAQLGR